MSRFLATRKRRRVTRLGHVRACLLACAVITGPATLVGLLVGPGQAGGVAIGITIAASTFAFGALVVDIADRINTSLVLPVGMTAYGVTVVILGTLVVRDEHNAGDVFAGLPWGVVVGVLTWVPFQAWWAWTSPTPYVVLPETPSRTSG